VTLRLEVEPAPLSRDDPGPPPPPPADRLGSRLSRSAGAHSIHGRLLVAASGANPCGDDWGDPECVQGCKRVLEDRCTFACHDRCTQRQCCAAARAACGTRTRNAMTPPPPSTPYRCVVWAGFTSGCFHQPAFQRSLIASTYTRERAAAALRPHDHAYLAMKSLWNVAIRPATASISSSGGKNVVRKCHVSFFWPNPEPGTTTMPVASSRASA